MVKFPTFHIQLTPEEQKLGALISCTVENPSIIYSWPTEFTALPYKQIQPTNCDLIVL